MLDNELIVVILDQLEAKLKMNEHLISSVILLASTYSPNAALGKNKALSRDHRITPPPPRGDEPKVLKKLWFVAMIL